MSMIIPAMMRCGKVNTSLIAKEMSKANNKSFKTNDVQVFCFLQSKSFLIDDSLWRMHTNMLFDFYERTKVNKRNISNTNKY